MIRYVVTSISLLLIAAGLAGYIILWHADHRAIAVPMSSPDGEYIAQFYVLSEGSAKANGDGVLVHHYLVPPWLNSTLVFAAHCEQGELAWRSEKDLSVICEVSQGKPLLFPPPSGIVVTHVGSS